MSDWSNTRASLGRIRENWRLADEGARWDLVFWAAGLAMMGSAIVSQFGVDGFLFVGGFVVWWSVNSRVG